LAMGPEGSDTAGVSRAPDRRRRRPKQRENTLIQAPNRGEMPWKTCFPAARLTFCALRLTGRQQAPARRAVHAALWDAVVHCLQLLTG